MERKADAVRLRMTPSPADSGEPNSIQVVWKPDEMVASEAPPPAHQPSWRSNRSGAWLIFDVRYLSAADIRKAQVISGLDCR